MNKPATSRRWLRVYARVDVVESTTSQNDTALTVRCPAPNTVEAVPEGQRERETFARHPAATTERLCRGRRLATYREGRNLRMLFAQRAAHPCWRSGSLRRRVDSPIQSDPIGHISTNGTAATARMGRP